MKHRLKRRYGHAGHPLLPRIHIDISRGVTAFRAATGDKFAIEARLQKHYGGDWALLSLQFAKTAEEARSAARALAAHLTAKYKPGSPVDITHGARGFGEG